MPDALQVMAEGMRLRAGTDDEDIAGVDAALETAVEQEPIDQAAQTERKGNESDRDQNDAAGDIRGVNQVERSGEQQAGGQAGLNIQSLLMKKTNQPGRGIELQTAADDNERNGKSAQEGEQDAHGTAMNEGAVPKTFCACYRAGMQFVQSGQQRGSDDGNPIQDHPQLGLAP
jgi:hypothetical protein